MYVFFPYSTFILYYAIFMNPTVIQSILPRWPILFLIFLTLNVYPIRQTNTTFSLTHFSSFTILGSCSSYKG